jgi:ribosome maturation protein SDO1
MVSIQDATMARLTKGGVTFEILVDPDLALTFRKGNHNMNMEEILASQAIFTDARRGERASEDDIEKAFGKADLSSIASAIIIHGELQLTTEQRRRFIEEKRKKLVDMISRQGMDPKTKLPHPPQRIMNAMEEAKVHIDPFRPAEDQLKDVLAKIQEVLPVSLERIEIAIKVPMSHAGKASSIIREITPVKSEEWRSDSWLAVIEIPAGMQSDIYSRLNKLTAGSVEVKIIKEHKI